MAKCHIDNGSPYPQHSRTHVNLHVFMRSERRGWHKGKEHTDQEGEVEGFSLWVASKKCETGGARAKLVDAAILLEIELIDEVTLVQKERERERETKTHSADVMQREPSNVVKLLQSQLIESTILTQARHHDLREINAEGVDGRCNTDGCSTSRRTGLKTDAESGPRTDQKRTSPETS